MQYSDISLVYILNYSVRRIRDFFKHWYVDGFLKAVDLTLHIFERLDRHFALRITAKNWFQPLYRDYTIIGYIWGFIFRTVRIMVGLIVYLIVLVSAILLFLLWVAVPALVFCQIWAAFPALVVYQIFKNI